MGQGGSGQGSAARRAGQGMAKQPGQVGLDQTRPHGCGIPWDPPETRFCMTGAMAWAQNTFQNPDGTVCPVCSTVILDNTFCS